MAWKGFFGCGPNASARENRNLEELSVCGMEAAKYSESGPAPAANPLSLEAS